uniref:Putative fatty acyl-coa reductase n=1 Tax=Lutzomyia longipalpis TaxID=7200 RepID=A0A1B0CLK8_LUTLO
MTGLPAGIVRSALVLGFYEHQIPGWMGNSQSGQCGLVKGYVKGAVRSVLGARATHQNIPSIIHLSGTRSTNPLTIQGFTDILNEESWKNPCDSYVFLPRCKVRNGWRSDLYMLLCYFIALMFYIPDYLLKLTPEWMSTTNLVLIQYKASKHFAQLPMILTDLDIKNAQNLAQRLHPDDQKKYSFDTSKINWNKLIGNCIAWLRKYYYKDSCSVTWMHRAVQIGCLFIEGAWYLWIFFTTTLAFLVAGFLLEYTMVYVLLVGLAVGLGLAGFVLWL